MAVPYGAGKPRCASASCSAKMPSSTNLTYEPHQPSSPAAALMASSVKRTGTSAALTALMASPTRCSGSPVLATALAESVPATHRGSWRQI
eukprot:463918-Pleurochrysis_carterae.AAC.2